MVTDGGRSHRQAIDVAAQAVWSGRRAPLRPGTGKGACAPAAHAYLVAGHVGVAFGLSVGPAIGDGRAVIPSG